MTYCLALNLDAGLVLLADSRTNAGVDHIATFSKLFTWSSPGGPGAAPRAIAVMVAGNLSVTQEILALNDEEIANSRFDPDNAPETILTAPNMFRVADSFGRKMVDVQNRRGPALTAAGVAAASSMIVAGRIGDEPARIFMVYQAGNFIEATRDTPFLQIGEAKYGKPILDRVLGVSTSIEDGVRAAILSMDATVRSNLSVGAPLDLAVSRGGGHDWTRRRIEAHDPVYQQISNSWAEHLKAGFATIPELPLIP